MSYILPAEWTSQSAVLLSWPHSNTDWHSMLAAVEKTYGEICCAISQFQDVVIICQHQKMHQSLQQKFSSKEHSNRIHFIVADYNDTWIRDYGPITLLSPNSPILLDFQFNGWGNKFKSTLDNQVSKTLKRKGFFGQVALRTETLVLEGGSIESDGEGTLLTTEHCLLSPQRNPHLNKKEIEAELIRCLAIERVLWLKEGNLEGDDTDSHIDTLVRFCSPSVICYVSCDDPNDTHYKALKTMETQLKTFRTRDGKNYTLLPLPWPSAKYNAAGERLPASYANFLIINDAVLLPTYNDNNDERAIDVLSKAFPERKIIPINCLSLIEQFGSLHCITMQLPKGVIKPKQP